MSGGPHEPRGAALPTTSVGDSMNRLLFLWAITGGAVATAIMIRIWLLDPPAGVGSRFVGLLAAGMGR